MPKIKNTKVATEPKTEGMVIDDTPSEIAETPVEEETIEIPESVTAEDEVTIEQDLVQKAPVKSVRICPNTDHSCSIGGVRYFLKKGVCQNVPVEVKDILVKAGLLSPL